jgi:hypothetical protein
LAEAQKMIEEKAFKIEERLDKIESPHFGGTSAYEEDKESALVPYMTPDVPQSEGEIF